MFHEDRELITKLKGTNARFTTLFDKHNNLDEEIAELQKSNMLENYMNQMSGTVYMEKMRKFLEIFLKIV